ncbi:cystatin-A1-like [Sparus aurata]|uniref:cystatin-A1-like n=1 Tax=Sparus aurata TaxID=8175 RepID=UPI0011C0D13A|nr:cystatin-A1-like [Sparus aurata]
MTEPTTMDIMFGGWSETRDADKETQWICDQVRSLVQGETNKIYQEYRAIKYRIQVVAGTNYLIKVCVGGPSYIHLSVFQALPCYGGYLGLTGAQEDKTQDNPLEPISN